MSYTTHILTVKDTFTKATQYPHTWIVRNAPGTFTEELHAQMLKIAQPRNDMKKM